MTAARAVCKSRGTAHYRADARHCNACSRALAGPDGCAEFKQVTVLFVDMGGSDARWWSHAA